MWASPSASADGSDSDSDAEADVSASLIHSTKVKRAKRTIKKPKRYEHAEREWDAAEDARVLKHAREESMTVGDEIVVDWEEYPLAGRTLDEVKERYKLLTGASLRLPECSKGC